MRTMIERPVPAVMAVVAIATLAAVLPGYHVSAVADTAPAEEQPAPAVQAPVAPTEAAGTGASDAGPPTDTEKGAVPRTLEQIRADMAAAKERRQALLQPDPVVADAETRKALLDKWGVEVNGVRLAARGYMIDFRFRVLDVDKALPLFDPRIQPYLLTEGTNIKLPVPVGEKVGAFRTTNRGNNITADRDYYMLFANPDSYVKPGQKVSVVIGEFRVEDLTLQ